MSAGSVDIPVKIIEGNDTLVMLARIVNALEGTGRAADTAAPKARSLGASLSGVGEAARHVNEIREAVVSFGEGLVAAAETALPGAPLYTVGKRSFSAEFYARGQAKTIDANAFPQIAAGAAAAFSVPPDMAPLAEKLGLQNLGAYGRHVLFLGPSKSEMN